MQGVTLFGMSFGDLPPEMQEALRQMMDQHQQESELHNMHVESSRHRMRDFLEGLNEEQLLCLRGLVHMVMADSDDETAGFYLGLTASMLSGKFGYCVMCQTKHASIEDIVHTEAEQSAPEKGAGMRERAVEERDERDSTMAEYNLQPNPMGGYECTYCGQPYQSIEDRMLRPSGKEGCSGCVQKEKWG